MFGSEWRDERNKDDETYIDHALGDLGDSADVPDAVFFGEAEIPR